MGLSLLWLTYVLFSFINQEGIKMDLKTLIEFIKPVMRHVKRPEDRDKISEFVDRDVRLRRKAKYIGRTKALVLFLYRGNRSGFFDWT